MEKNQFIINILNAESMKLESLVEYQNEKLVNLTIAQLPNITMILFAIDQRGPGGSG